MPNSGICHTNQPEAMYYGSGTGGRGSHLIMHRTIRLTGSIGPLTLVR